jgi:hypothetical protein
MDCELRRGSKQLANAEAASHIVYRSMFAAYVFAPSPPPCLFIFRCDHDSDAIAGLDAAMLGAIPTEGKPARKKGQCARLWRRSEERRENFRRETESEEESPR